MNVSYTINKICAKRTHLHRILFAALVILCSLSTYAQDSDNQEFWFVAPDASFSHNDRPTFFMITTGDTPASVTISMPANKSFKKITKNIPANSYWKYSFSNDAEISLIENDINSSGIPTQKGFYITSSAPVSAYYQIDGDRNYQKEIFTLKGKKALGTEFYMPFQKAYPISDRDEYNNEQFRQIQIVATKNGTNVVISPKSDQALFKAADGAINSKSPLESRTITLNEGETLLWRENARHTPDLIGTKITSTDKEKPIAVTLFEDCVQDGKDGSVDPIGDQLVPTHNLGKNYIVVKGYSSGNATDHAVILAVATGKTDVWIRSENNDEKKIATLSQGEYWSEDLGKGGDSPGAFYISTSQPVYCMHQSASGSELGGAILPSLYSISGKRITFMKGNKNTTVNSMFLVFRESAKDGFTIDNKRLTVDAKSIGFGDWRYAKVNLTNTTDTLQVCAVANTKGSFSLGYFNGASSTSLYGYFSAFGTFSFASDTIYHCGTSHEFDAPYALSYKWTLPDNTTSDKSVLTATKSGKYTLYVDQDPYKLTDETILCLQNFNHKFYAPSKLLVGKSYNFSIQLNPENDPYNKFNATYEWDFGEGAKVTTDIKKKWVNVYYETAGPKKVALKVTNTNAHCDTTITHEFKVLDTPEVMYWKTDAENQNWNDENNWTDAQGNDLFAVPSAQTKVYLPGPANDARNYPSLNRETDRYFYGDPEVNEIVFGYGSELYYQHLLKYNKAYVDYNWGYYGSDGADGQGQPKNSVDNAKILKRNTWHILAAPLKGMASGDFSLAGRPFSWQKKFQTTSESVAIEGRFYSSFPDNATPLSNNNNAIAVKMAGNNTTQIGYKDQTYLENLQGVIEVPYFENGSLAPSHPGHSYDALSKISNFYYFDTKTLKLLNSPVSSISRGGNAYRFVYETDDNKVPSDNIYKLNLDPESISTSGEVMVGNPLLSPMYAWGFYGANAEVIDKEKGYKLLSEDGSTWEQKSFNGDDRIPAWRAFIVTLLENPSGKLASRQTSSTRGTFATELFFPLETYPIPRSTSNRTRSSFTKSDMRSSLYMGILKENVLSGDEAILQDERDASLSEIPKMIQPDGHAVPEVFFIDSEKSVANLIQNYRQGQKEVPIGVKTSDVHSRLSLQFKNVPMFTAATGVKAVLVDKYLNIKQDLARNATYGFNQHAMGLDKQSVDKTRFVLQLGDETNVDATPENDIRIHYDSGLLKISSNENIEHVAVYDSQGRLVYSGSSMGVTEYMHEISLQGGLFVVQVRTISGKLKVEKIMGRK